MTAQIQDGLSEGRGNYSRNATNLENDVRFVFVRSYQTESLVGQAQSIGGRCDDLAVTQTLRLDRYRPDVLWEQTHDLRDTNMMLSIYRKNHQTYGHILTCSRKLSLADEYRCEGQGRTCSVDVLVGD